MNIYGPLLRKDRVKICKNFDYNPSYREVFNTMYDIYDLYNTDLNNDDISRELKLHKNTIQPKVKKIIDDKIFLRINFKTDKFRHIIPYLPTWDHFICYLIYLDQSVLKFKINIFCLDIFIEVNIHLTEENKSFIPKSLNLNSPYYLNLRKTRLDLIEDTYVFSSSHPFLIVDLAEVGYQLDFKQYPVVINNINLI